MANKILVVDDEPDLVDILTFELRAQGHEVLSAGNGKEALQTLKKEQPNLIISDINMPEMDGVDFFTNLKKDRRTKNIPILILTASGKLEKYFRILKVEDFMSKPFEMEELHAKVKQLLEAPPRQVQKVQDPQIVVDTDPALPPAFAPAVDKVTSKSAEPVPKSSGRGLGAPAIPSDLVRSRKKWERVEEMQLMMKIAAFCVLITAVMVYIIKASHVMDLFLPKGQ